MVTLAEIKNQATILKNYLKQSNSSISHSSCLHAVAKMYGFSDWNTMAALLDDGKITHKKSQNQSEVNEKHFLGGFSKVSGQAWTCLANLGSTGEINLDCFRILSFIFANMKENSVFIDQARIAKSLLIKNKDFIVALNLLVDSKFLLRFVNGNSDDELIINPFLFWKGDPDKHDETINQLWKKIENDQNDEIYSSMLRDNRG